MKKTIYIFSSGELSRKDNTIYFENDEGRRFIPVEDTGEIMIFGELDLNKKLLEFLSVKEITLHFFNYHGYYMGSFYPREHLNSGYMTLKQAEHYLDEEKRLIIAQELVRGASKNIRQVLKYYMEKEKFRFRAHIHGVAQLLGFLNSFKQDIAGITTEWSAVRIVNIANQPGYRSLPGSPGKYIES